MKSFLGTLFLIAIASAAYAQSAQSPLAPPKVPASGPLGNTLKLKLGDKAPEFALPNGDGKLIALSEFTQRSPVVLVFYRGFW
jgi:AhpC/TSA family